MLPQGEESVKELASSLGKQWSRRSVEGQTLLLRQVPYRGSVGLLITKKGLLGLTGFEDETALVEQLLISNP